MHKQSQRQKRAKITICHFKELGCLREALNSGAPVDGGVVQATPPHPAADEPGDAQTRALPDLLCLCIISWDGSTSPDNRRGEIQLSFPAWHAPPHTDPSHVLTVRSLFHASSTRRGLEQRRPEDGPPAKVTMNWEVRTCSAHSPPTGIPALTQGEAGSSPRKLKVYVSLTRAILVLP